jgi:hypothetical protein
LSRYFEPGDKIANAVSPHLTRHPVICPISTGPAMTKVGHLSAGVIFRFNSHEKLG